MYFLRRKSYINQKKKELNKNNPYRLTWKDNILRFLEKDVLNKFSTIVIISIVSLICARIAINYTLLYSPISYFSSEVLGSLDSVSFYTELMKDFYTTIISILATILSISIAILLLYLQIVSDKYSIEFTSYTFTKWEGIRVISVFLVTIVYSLYNLLTIKQNITSCDFSDLIVAFLLTILCLILLFSYMYNTLKSLLPQNFIKEQFNLIDKSSRLALDFYQDKKLIISYLQEELSDIENIKIVSDRSNKITPHNLENPIDPLKYGVIVDIDVKRLKQCSELMKRVSEKCKLVVFLLPNLMVKNSKDVLGYVECDDEKTINYVKKLVLAAYVINDANHYVYDHSNFSPITSFMNKMIRDHEITVLKTSVDHFTKSICKYIEYAKEFSLFSDETSDLHTKVTILPGFIHNYYDSLKQVSKVALDESDVESINILLHSNLKIGIKLIEMNNTSKFENVLGFFKDIDKYDDTFTDKILDRLLDLEETWYIQYRKNICKKENIKYGYIEKIINYCTDRTKELIDKSPEYSIGYINRLCNIKIRIQEIKEQKQKDEFSQLLDENLFITGICIMLKVERKQYPIETAFRILDILEIYFRKYVLDQTYITNLNNERIHFSVLNWMHSPHLKSGYKERFFILLKSLSYKKSNNLLFTRELDSYIRDRHDLFNEQANNLSTNVDIWNEIFEGDSTVYFKKVAEKLF